MAGSRVLAVHTWTASIMRWCVNSLDSFFCIYEWCGTPVPAWRQVTISGTHSAPAAAAGQAAHATISGVHMIHESPRGDSDLLAAEARGWAPMPLEIFFADRRRQRCAGNINISQIAKQSVRDYFAPSVWIWRAVSRPRGKSKESTAKTGCQPISI